MRNFYNKLCLSLLEEHFGSIVRCIGNNLLHGTKTLCAICSGTGLPPAKVREGLCVLIIYGYVTCQQINNVTEYTLDLNKIFMILQYSRYMFFTKTCCGDEAEVMLEEILKHGYITASEVIIKTYKRVEQTPAKFTKEISLPSLKDTFELLVKNQFLMRVVSFETTKTKEPEKPDYNLPKLNLEAMHHMLQERDADPGDTKVYWKVNVDRFTQDLRDQVIVSAMIERFDDNAGKLMQQLINLMYMRTASWADTSNPIPYTEIKEAMKKLDCPKLEQYLDQYLQIMQEDSSQFIKRVGDSGGGQYSVNMKNGFKQLAWATMENIVAEVFDSKAARIFRLVRKESGATLEQIQHLAMIPAKEAKKMAYCLTQENYIQTQEIKKGGTSTMKASFRFTVELPIIIDMTIEHCCQALYHYVQKRVHESISNKRIIEKQLRVQILSDNMRKHGATEEQLADIAEMMTPSENAQFEKAQNAIKRQAAAELYIDQTLFLLMMYFRYH